MSIDKSEFQVPIFEEEGFVRRKCTGCGSHFWTQVADRTTCGDFTCEEYQFIGNPPTKMRLSVGEMRELFLSFFEKKGHARISPYPVVARWRDDVFLVGASIYDFQPYVTEGVIPPPANPLVISQPSLRFTDIDNVGPTMGRYLLIFEMGGAHAFNYPDKEVYWKDNTIRFHHELLTEVVGVPSDLVTYKEHFWSGGGNAGPDVEACVQGLEVSTLVFMQYKVVGEQLVQLPIRTVDTGYGIERWAWLSQGTPNCFEVIYGPVLKRIFDLGKVRADDKILAQVTKVSALMDVERTGDRVAARQNVARRIGMEAKELEKILTPVEHAYAVADHTKAITFLLAEGVVPSNVREGYLTRLLIRRTYRMLRNLGIEDRLIDIVESQIEYWSRDFPGLKENREGIVKALRVEEAKYQRTLERGGDLIKKIASEQKSKGRTEIPTETLVELYDSHGVVPEIVAEIAKPLGFRVNPPSNFAAMLARRHMTSDLKQEDELSVKLKDKVETLPGTVPVYYEEPYRSQFEARVADIIDRRYLVLDRTCFYPEGGGQPADIGKITSAQGVAKVVDAQLVGKVVVHVVEDAVPSVGDAVKGEIDWERRSHLMRHHTGTHVLLGAVRRVLGSHAWQAGAQKGVESSRIDISHYEHLTDEEVRRIESLATDAVLRNIPVEAMWVPREKAEQTYGFRLYQGGVVPGKEIRVIKIGDWDVEACGGTHVRATGEVGIIKIQRTERIQDGVERIIFVAGQQALRAFEEKDHALTRIASVLGSPLEKADAYLETVLKEKERLSKRLTGFIEQLAEREAEALSKKARTVGKVRLAVTRQHHWTEDEMVVLTNKIVEREPSVVFVGLVVNSSVRIFVGAGKKAILHGVNAARLATALGRIIGGGGGGRENFAQGGGPKIAKVSELIRKAPVVLRQSMKK